ncbi:MAG TPA: hypothetical protein PKU78_00880 [Candidatus Dojkabacteria bacterium]|nr:hypothetical protein [Candidatus Dojkabacteria bacterium]HRO64755.1 hypothetical protein [Candidatus Dojkabacteria bacterium]HRP51227.1 hypothetical protein [Candidatus Dojkabacteria bacterium]
MSLFPPDFRESSSEVPPNNVFESVLQSTAGMAIIGFGFGSILTYALLSLPESIAGRPIPKRVKIISSVLLGLGSSYIFQQSV